MTSDLAIQRQQKDHLFKQSPDSPIPYDLRDAFTGLSYYPEDRSLCLIVQPTLFPEQEPITMPTSTGRVQHYTRWGEFAFNVDGQPARLTIYLARWGGYFVPFVDATSGTETYATGRYLELEELADGRFMADFNRAYHPYCAYSEDYSCPIPPAENRIDIPIRAGERLPVDA